MEKRNYNYRKSEDEGLLSKINRIGKEGGPKNWALNAGLVGAIVGITLCGGKLDEDYAKTIVFANTMPNTEGIELLVNSPDGGTGWMTYTSQELKDKYGENWPDSLGTEGEDYKINTIKYMDLD